MYCLKLRFNVTFIRKASGKKKKKIIIINYYNKQDIKQRFIVIHLFCGQTRTAAMKYFIFMWIFILWMSLIQPVILGIYIYGLQNDSMCLTHKVFACVVCISFFRWSSSSLSLHFSKNLTKAVVCGRLSWCFPWLHTELISHYTTEALGWHVVQNASRLSFVYMYAATGSFSSSFWASLVVCLDGNVSWSVWSRLKYRNNFLNSCCGILYRCPLCTENESWWLWYFFYFAPQAGKNSKNIYTLIYLHKYNLDWYFYTDIHVPQRIHPYDFVDPLSCCATMKLIFVVQNEMSQ